MNRRNFLKTLVTAVVGLTVTPIPITLFNEPVSIGAVGEFEYYMIWTMKMWVDNPRKCAYITNIGE